MYMIIDFPLIHRTHDCVIMYLVFRTYHRSLFPVCIISRGFVCVRACVRFCAVPVRILHIMRLGNFLVGSVTPPYVIQHQQCTRTYM